MPPLLTYFPTVSYDLANDGNRLLLTNTTLRFRIRDVVRREGTSYFDYFVGEGELPWMLADRYYDDPSLDWVILMTNGILDPFYGWPLTSENLDRYLTHREATEDGYYRHDVHHREWIVQHHGVLEDGTIVPEESVVVDEVTYETLPAPDRRIVTNVEYEENLNEERRRIRILDRTYVPGILTEAERILLG